MTKKARPRDQRIQGIILTTLLFAASANAAGPAGVKLDGSIGGATQVLAGPTYNITQNLGKLAGGNLFYSFQYFNIGPGDTALFSTTSLGINNVISRVTGGYSSTIGGTIALRSAYGDPNLFLINPAGVTFTAKAQVDVPAAFNVTTANYLKFSNGVFYADPTKQSTLSAAAPEAFGFLGTTRAAVDILGANLNGGAGGAGEFQIAAGNVTIDGEGGASSTGSLESVGVSNTTGNIRVIAVGSAAAQVPLSGPFTATDGTVTIRNGGALITQGDGQLTGGAIDVFAGNLLIDGLGLPLTGYFQTGIIASTDVAGLGPDGAGSVVVNVGNAAHFVNGGAIGSQTFGSGPAGDISFSASSTTINGEGFNVFTGLFNYTGSTGSTGNIVVNVKGPVSITDAGAVSAFTNGSGNAGQVNVQAGSLSINGDNTKYLSGISSDATQGSAGAAGEVVVNVAGSATMVNGGAVAADSYSSGNAGQIRLQAGSLNINGGQQTSGYPGLEAFTTGILARGALFGAGDGGQIDITVDGGTSVSNNGAITSATGGIGIKGTGGSIDLRSASLTIVGGYISSSAGLLGNAGQIMVDVSGAVSLADLGTIFVFGDPNTHSVGLDIRAGSLMLTGDAGIVTNTAGSEETTGVPIKVNVTGAALIEDAGAIDSENPTGDYSGNLSLTAKSLSIEGAGAPNFTGIVNQTFGFGNAGNINVQVGTLTINGGNNSYLTGISSASIVDPYTRLSTLDTGSAGNVVVKVAGAAEITDGGSITTATQTYGNGGSVKFSAGSLLMQASRGTVTDTVISSDSDIGAPGNAGDVNVTVGSLIVDGGGSRNFVGIASRALHNSAGTSGVVTVDVTGTARLQDGGAISTSSAATVADPKSLTPGQVTVEAEQIELDGGEITAAASGNVAAGSIDVSYGSSLQMQSAAISTFANQGNGGPIRIAGKGELSMDQSSITTSVSGTSGNGGNIEISVPTIVMNTAAIQANTNAQNGVGGTINVNAGAILPSFQSISFAGKPQELNPNSLGQNLIQAAAPDGVSGALNVTNATLDIGSSLLGLTGRPAAPTALGRSLCGFMHGSSLSIAGRGGLPNSAYDPLWIDTQDGSQSAAENLHRLPMDLSRPPFLFASTPPCWL